MSELSFYDTPQGLTKCQRYDYAWQRQRKHSCQCDGVCSIAVLISDMIDNRNVIRGES